MKTKKKNIYQKPNKLKLKDKHIKPKGVSASNMLSFLFIFVSSVHISGKKN